MGGKGSGGHNRKPTAQKLAEGNRGKRPLNLREPKALPGEPQMPSGMTEQARAVWPEVVAMLTANDVLFKTDGLAIAALCSHLVLFWQADRAVSTDSSLHDHCRAPPVIRHTERLPDRSSFAFSIATTSGHTARACSVIPEGENLVHGRCGEGNDG